MNRLVRLCALLLVVPLLMGATITCTTATANPNNASQMIYLAGNWSLGQMEVAGQSRGCAKIPGELQYVWRVGTDVGHPNTSWSCNLTQMGVGDWQCWGMLVYFDVSGEMPIPKDVTSPSKRVTVQF